MKQTRHPHWLRAALLILGVVVLTNAPTDDVYALVTNPVVLQNTPLNFEGTVVNAGLNPSSLVLGGPDPNGFSGNWSVEVIQGTFAGMGQNNDIKFNVFHNIAPHPELGERALNLSTNTLVDIVPGISTGAFITAPTPHGLVHFDIFRVDYKPIAFNTSLIRCGSYSRTGYISPAWGRAERVGATEKSQSIGTAHIRHS
jgi:hypothetical protein